MSAYATVREVFAGNPIELVGKGDVCCRLCTLFDRSAESVQYKVEHPRDRWWNALPDPGVNYPGVQTIGGHSSTFETSRQLQREHDVRVLRKEV